MPQNKFIPIENWLNNNLCYDEIKNCLENALSFYGDYCKRLLFSSDNTLFLNDKKNRWVLGTFSHFDNSITLHEEFYAVQSENRNWFNLHFSYLM